MQKKDKNRIIGAVLGTLVEYYDYSLYAFGAGIIASKFFSKADHLTALTSVFALYAISYCAKPVGSLIFGWLGDHYGRKKALSVSIIGIAMPTLMIGLTPEYSEIGSISTIILCICRFIQSIFIAGEYDGAAIYVIEHLGPQKKYTASAITRFTGALGLLLGMAITNLCNSHIFGTWGWRIPFFLSLPFAIVILYYRQALSETPQFNAAKDNKNFKTIKMLTLLCNQWKPILKVIFLAGGFGATYQISIVFMKQYLPMVIPQSELIISTFSVLLVLVFSIAMPIAGILADNLGAKIIIRSSVFLTVLSCILVIIGIQYAMLNLVLASSLLLAVSVAPFNAIAHGIAVGEFPVLERYRSITIGHTIGSMLMSGTANYVCLVSMKFFHLNIFPMLYICVFAILTYYIINTFSQR